MNIEPAIDEQYVEGSDVKRFGVFRISDQKYGNISAHLIRILDTSYPIQPLHLIKEAMILRWLWKIPPRGSEPNLVWYK